MPAASVPLDAHHVRYLLSAEFLCLIARPFENWRNESAAKTFQTYPEWSKFLKYSVSVRRTKFPEFLGWPKQRSGISEEKESKKVQGWTSPKFCTENWANPKDFCGLSARQSWGLLKAMQNHRQTTCWSWRMVCLFKVKTMLNNLQQMRGNLQNWLLVSSASQLVGKWWWRQSGEHNSTGRIQVKKIGPYPPANLVSSQTSRFLRRFSPTDVLAVDSQTVGLWRRKKLWS